jgi:hypothetical protein
MNWKYILKTEEEKAHCGTHKEDEKMLYGGQKKLDVAKPKGKITGEDFAELRRRKKIQKKMKSDAQIEKEILAEIKKEGGALGMKNLKAICPPKELKRVLNAMKRKKVIFMHKDGDIYTHSPR